MAIYGVLPCFPTLQLLVVFCVLAAIVPDHVQGRPFEPHECPSFSCGNLGDVSYPFRQRGDPLWCGSQSYELDCSDSKAVIRIDNATYYVTHINQRYREFWVVDTDLGNNSCPLPRWKRFLDTYMILPNSSNSFEFELIPGSAASWATFVKCLKQVNNNGMYRPVSCLSTKHSFVYVLTGDYSATYIENLEPSCGLLAMTPFVGQEARLSFYSNLSYADVLIFMRKGFLVRFPFTPISFNRYAMKECLMEPFSGSSEELSTSMLIRSWILKILVADQTILSCAADTFASPYSIILWSIIYAITLFKMIFGGCRFVLAPIAVLTFLAHKYLKIRITIDAVEKFLQMQQFFGPARYAYTDITAVTSHFREKLGQGGYGSVYKVVLLPGGVHVAVKMLGNSSCNGEDFISEVSTIGRIHHINVVRLVGFCSGEMRRALIYEYMPRGSLDKYMFSLEKNFSWDKLNEIALGIARGINYLHQGCDMQILHFDIKPHNILLDDNFVPKVADFGLARLFPRDNSFVPLSAMRGTIGYIAPEMVSRSFGIISSKSDVYSFGMLLLEMAGGRRNADPNAANSSQSYYPSWVHDRLIEQRVSDVSVADMHELEKKLCIIGLWCIQMKSNDRPKMSEVIEMLESNVNVMEMPSRPFFCDGDKQNPTVGSYYLSSELDYIDL